MSLRQSALRHRLNEQPLELLGCTTPSCHHTTFAGLPHRQLMAAFSGAGTNSKVGGTNPARSAGKKFFGRALPLFGSKSTICHFGERFRDGKYSLVSFLFACFVVCLPPVPMELAPLAAFDLSQQYCFYQTIIIHSAFVPEQFCFPSVYVVYLSLLLSCNLS